MLLTILMLSIFSICNCQCGSQCSRCQLRPAIPGFPTRYQCQACNSPYIYIVPYVGAPFGTCQQCPSQCDCADSTTYLCQNCKTTVRYYYNFPTCSSCGPNCLSCTSLSACTSCESSYYILYSYQNSGSGTCTLCPNDCSLCINSYIDICKICNSQHYLSKTNYVTDTGKCNGCGDNCDTCSGPGNYNCNTCLSGYYFDRNSPYSTNGQCISCSSINCDVCVESHPNICTQCSTGYFLTITNTTSNTGACTQCWTTCSTCLNGLKNSCTACLTTSHYITWNNNSMISGSCDVCPTKCLTCINSYPNICDDCKNKNYLVITNPTDNTGSCYSCHYTCAQCSGPQQTQCTECNTGAHRINQFNDGTCPCDAWFMDDELNHQDCIRLVCRVGSGTSISTIGYCEVICGDGLVGDGQQCDDSNILDSDGCSADCQVEIYFRCYGGSATTSAVCMYEQPIGFTVLSVVKQPYLNYFTISMESNTTYEFMNRINYSAVSILGILYDDIHFSYSNGILTVSVNYSNDLHSTERSLLKFDFQNLSGMFANLSTNVMIIDLHSNNNEAINAYSPEIYEEVDKVGILCKVVTYFGLAIFIMSLVRGKVIGLQMIGLLQLVYFGMATIKYTGPLYYKMNQLKLSNGYNMILPNSTFNNLPYNIQVLNVYQLLLQNMNVMIIIPAAIIVLSFLMFVFYKLNLFPRQKWIQSYSKVLIGEYLLTFVVLSLYQYSFSLGIMLIYFIMEGMITYLSILAGVVFLVVTVLISIAFKFWTVDYFGQYKFFFKEQNFNQYYFILHLIQRFLIGLGFSLITNGVASNALAIIILITHCVYIGIVKPYAIFNQNIRSIVILSIGVICLTTYLIVAAIGSSYSSSQGFCVYSPYLVLSLCCVACCISLYFIILQIKRFLIIQLQSCFIPDIGKKTSMMEQFEKTIKSQMQKIIDAGQKPPINISRMTPKYRKKKKLQKIKDSSELTDADQNKLKDKIQNFDLYQAEWFQRHNKYNQAIQQLTSRSLDKDLVKELTKNVEQI